MGSKKGTETERLSLSEKKKVYAEIKEAFSCFVDFKNLKTTKRNPKTIKKALLYLNKDLTANVHDSGIENCGTEFMLEGIGRGMIRYSRRIAWMLRHYEWGARVPVRKDGNRARVLDLGCDVGEIRKIMSGSFYYPNPLYVGVDIDHKRLSQGFYAIRTARTPTLYVQHDVTLPLKFIKSNSVDCVFIGEIIEHFAKKWGKKMLEEVHRVLRKRGRYFISTPVRRNTKGYEFHVYEYNPEELKDILKKIGFSVTKAYGWVTTEKVLLKRMKKEDRLFYEKLTKNAHKDIVLPIIAHANPNYGDAFCLEGTKK